MSLQRDGNFEGIVNELGLSIEDSLIFLKEMNAQRWSATNSKSKERDDLTDEERAKIADNTKTIDYLMDFDSYYTDFIRFYNINLMKDDISFTEFVWLLNSLLEDEKANITKRIGFRLYKKSDNDSSGYASYMNTKKDLYNINPDVNADVVVNNVWSNIKKIGGN